MKYYLILNLVVVNVAFAAMYSGNYPWLMFICIAFSVFCNVKAIGFIKKYWNSKNYFGKSVLGALILSMEDLFLLLPLML